MLWRPIDTTIMSSIRLIEYCFAFSALVAGAPSSQSCDADSVIEDPMGGFWAMLQRGSALDRSTDTGADILNDQPAVDRLVPLSSKNSAAGQKTLGLQLHGALPTTGLGPQLLGSVSEGMNSNQQNEAFPISGMPTKSMAGQNALAPNQTIFVSTNANATSNASADATHQGSSQSLDASTQLTSNSLTPSREQSSSNASRPNNHEQAGSKKHPGVKFSQPAAPRRRVLAEKNRHAEAWGEAMLFSASVALPILCLVIGSTMGQEQQKGSGDDGDFWGEASTGRSEPVTAAGKGGAN